MTVNPSISRFVSALAVLVLAVPCFSQSPTFLKEEFEDLSAWEPLQFQRRERETTYEAVELDGESVLRIQFDDSASAIVIRDAYPVDEYPILRWSWRVADVIESGDPTEKSGDDYPIRIYVMFEAAQDTRSAGDRLARGAFRLFYGRYPPHSALNYIWANHDHDFEVIASPFARQSMMVIVDAGDTNVGRWREHEVNIVEDYRDAFGTDPPSRARIGIMGDGDQTGASGTSWMDYLVIEGER